jgi:ParB family chromosome partitioning protein
MVEVKEILLDKIVIPPERARATFTDEQHEELMASIKTNGFTVPILVTPQKDGTFLLIDGEHRVKIAKELGMKAVPAVITAGDEKKITLLNILANTARGTQNPVDVAQQLKKAKDAGATVEELAAATGHTSQWVDFYIALTELPDFYKQKLREGALKVGHIREALRLPTPAEVEGALQSALLHGWTVEDMKYYVERRIPEVEEIIKAEGVDALPPPPSPSETQEMVLYGNCLACGRKVPRRELRMPMICQDCYDLLFWLASQFKDTRKAADTLYRAYNFYMDFLEHQQNRLPPSLRGKETSQTVEREEVIEEKPPAKTDVELDEETLRLAKEIKKLKEKGLL